MKIIARIIALASCGSLALVSACKKQDEFPAPLTAPQSLESSASKAAEQAAAEAARIAEQARAAAEQAAAEAKKQVEAAQQEARKQTAAAQQPAQSAASQAATEGQKLIDQAKALINDKRYQDAMALVQKLAGMTLTPEQQQTVASLKSQLEKVMASGTAAEGTKALGGLLEGRK